MKFRPFGLISLCNTQRLHEAGEGADAQPLGRIERTSRRRLTLRLPPGDEAQKFQKEHDREHRRPEDDPQDQLCPRAVLGVGVPARRALKRPAAEHEEHDPDQKVPAHITHGNLPSCNTQRSSIAQNYSFVKGITQ